MRQYTALAVALLTVLACDNGQAGRSSAADDAETGGTIVISVASDPDVLFPPLLMSSSARQVSELVYDHLADLGSSLNTNGDAGFPGGASDGAFTYALYKDSATASPSAPLIVAIDSVTTPDSLTAVFWYSK